MAEGPADAPRPLTNDMLEVREDFERGLSVVPPVTLALILVCTVVYLRQLYHMLGSAPGLASEVLFLPGAMNRERVLAGEWWRVLTATWLHATPDHLIGNMAALFILGMGCEHAFGSARTLAIYAFTGVAGSLAGMSHAEPSVGASGAIFGLLGLLASALWVNREHLVLRDRRLPTVLLCWAVYALINGALTPYVDNMAHAGGFAAGLLAGRLLKPREGAPGPVAQFAAGTAAAGLLYALYRLRHGLL
jgi:rhomboid protease GluP